MRDLEKCEYDAAVFLPYTAVEGRDPKFPNKWEMSFYTKRNAEAVAIGYKAGLYDKVLVPGEGDKTAFLVEDHLISAGIPATAIKPFLYKDGTQQQLDPIADLQHQGKLGRVRIYGWAFHDPRVGDIKNRWNIAGDIAEVEHEVINAQVMKDKTEVTAADLKAISDQRQIWIESPRYQALIRTEQGIPALLMALDTPFRRLAPFARTAKWLMGPTITDIEQVTLLRLQAIKKFFRRS